MKPASAAQQRIVDADHPWLGLESFTEATQKYYFGRDSEIADIFVRTRENPLTILYGQSGLGKTSLLGAGLIPKLKLEGFRPVLLRLRYEKTDAPLMTQVRDALALAAVSNRAIPGPSEGGSGQECPDYAAPDTLWELLHHLHLRPDDLASSPPILIFDQFEEAFTLGQRAERLDEVRALFTELADVIENRPPVALKQRFTEDRQLVRDYDLSPSPLRIAITLREDYLSHLEAWKRTLPSLMRNRMALHLLSGPQALDAVFKPGHMEGRHLVDEDTAARIVRFVANRRPDVPLAEIGAVPPLLSLVCDELNTQRIEQKKDRITAERVSTGLADQTEAEDDLIARSRIILAQFYERSFTGLPAGVQHFVEDRMVTVAGHRCPVSRDDAMDALKKCRVRDPSETMQSLVNRRLISTEERGGVTWFEITHDVLVPIVKVEKDKRLARQRLRRMLVASLGMLVLLGVIGGATAWAVKSQRDIEEKARIETDRANTALLAALEGETKAKLHAEKLSNEAKVAQKIAENAQSNAEKALKRATTSDNAADVAKEEARKTREAAKEQSSFVVEVLMSSVHEISGKSSKDISRDTIDAAFNPIEKYMEKQDGSSKSNLLRFDFNKRKAELLESVDGAAAIEAATKALEYSASDSDIREVDLSIVNLLIAKITSKSAPGNIEKKAKLASSELKLVNVYLESGVTKDTKDALQVEQHLRSAFEHIESIVPRRDQENDVLNDLQQMKHRWVDNGMVLPMEMLVRISKDRSNKAPKDTPLKIEWAVAELLLINAIITDFENKQRNLASFAATQSAAASTSPQVVGAPHSPTTVTIPIMPPFLEVNTHLTQANQLLQGIGSGGDKLASAKKMLTEIDGRLEKHGFLPLSSMTTTSPPPFTIPDIPSSVQITPPPSTAAPTIPQPAMPTIPPPLPNMPYVPSPLPGMPYIPQPFPVIPDRR